jgi:RHS repeat-associated protein
LDKVTNSSRVVKQNINFDACSVKHGFCEARTKTDVELIPPEERRREGRRRNPTNWTYASIPATIFSRGYTGHEHLDQFNLINMNGRMYDPILGRFLSPDIYVQAPDFTQSYNRYSYCLNNPLAFTDPSGYAYMADGGSGRISFDNSWIHTEMQDGGAGANKSSSEKFYEEYMKSKGFTYVRNQYGIGTWASNSDYYSATYLLGG